MDNNTYFGGIQIPFSMLYLVNGLPERHWKVIEEIEDLRRVLKHSTSDNRRRWTGLLRSAFAHAIQGSNSIEGYNVTYEDAMAAVDGEEPEIDPRQETWMAIKGYRDALTYILQLAKDPYFRHNEGTLRGLHFMMVSHDIGKNPGLWRPGSIYVKREATGETVYEGPDVSLVPALMGEFVESLNAPNDLPVMVRAALAHLNLVMVHPFSDGNGRMGRALQTLVLAREGIIDPRFSSIEETLAKFTLEYYDVLAQVGQGSWRPDRDPLPFVQFCLRLHHQQAQTLLWRMKRLDKLWNALEDEVSKRTMNERVLGALVDAAMGLKVTNSRYRKMADVSDQVASKDLKTLCEQGWLVPQGERRGRHYVAGDWLRDLRRRSQERLVLVDPFSDSPVSAAQEYLPGLDPKEATTA